MGRSRSSSLSRRRWHRRPKKDTNHEIFNDSEKQQAQRPYIRNQNGETSLHLAATSNNANDAGANAIAQDHDDRTSLHLAALTPLITAVKMGMEDRTMDLISAGADVDATDRTGMTALHWATLNNCHNLVVLLLQKGPNLNIQDSEGCTPLHYAKADIARCLLDAGADANVQNNAGFTPLHLAVVKIDTSLFKILLHRTKNLNTRCAQDSMTPLTDAVKNTMENMVYDLIKAGADVNVDSGKGMTPLHWAANFSDLPDCEDDAAGCYYGYMKANAARMLLNAGADANAKDNLGNTPLHAALNAKAWPVLEVLLQHKATDLNALHASSKTLLMMVLQSDSESKAEALEAFENLIKAGASIHATDNEQKTALHYAAALDKYDELILLLKYGANVNAVDQNKMTALHWAGLFRMLEDVPLQNEANLNARDGYGQTPLDYDKAKIVKSLVDAGADTAAQDSNGATPLYLAVVRRDVNAFRVLLDHATDLNTHTTSGGLTPLIAAVDLGMEDMVFDLIGAGAYVNARNCNGATALHFAAWFSNIPNDSEDIATSRTKATRMLLDAGADPNTRDNFGDTALHIAVKSMAWPVCQELLRDSRTDLNAHNMHDGSKTPLMMILEVDADIEVFVNLIDAGASVSETDSKGKTALHYAAKLDKATELNMLLERGAEINAQDCKGQTSLFLAAREGSYESCEILIKSYFANRDIPDSRGKQPIDVASERGHEAIVTLLNVSMPAG